MDTTLRSLSRLIAGIAITGLIAILALPALAEQGIAVERLPLLQSPTSLVQASPSDISKPTAPTKPATAAQKKKTSKTVAKKPAKKAQPVKAASAKKKSVKKTPVKASAKKKAKPTATGAA